MRRFVGKTTEEEELEDSLTHGFDVFPGMN